MGAALKVKMGKFVIKRFFLICATLFVVSCTSIQVQPLDPSLSVSKVCIEKNSKVLVSDFLDVLKTGFNRHNIDTQVFAEKAPDACQAILTYTALRSWEFTPYLSVAELWLHDQSGELIAHAKYHLKGKGGLSLTKWAGTESKMIPVIDKLLAGN